MNDCIGILYSDSEFMDLAGFLILAPPVGKHTPHLAVFDPGIPIYNWRGNERGIMQLFLLPGQFSLL
jgi:hypothetical protein